MKKGINIDFNKSDLFNADGFELSTIDHSGDKFNRSRDANDAISVIMFDLTSDNKINNLYLLDQFDYMNQKSCVSPLIEDINYNIDDDEYDTFKRCIWKDLGIKNISNLDSCYYLGKVDHNIPFQKTYDCYAFCVNDYIKSPKGFKIDMPEGEIDGKRFSLKKMKFSRAIKGECKDSLVLSSCLLLLSYIS